MTPTCRRRQACKCTGRLRRVAFRFEDGEAVDVDLIDYH